MYVILHIICCMYTYRPECDHWITDDFFLLFAYMLFPNFL